MLAVVGGGCSTPATSYETPQAAVDALVGALRTDDTAKLRDVLGSDADALLNSGDAVADANAREEFMRLYDEKHELVTTDDSVTLQIGKTDWPLPIPVVKDDKGWSFDTVAGADEMLSRRIGRNELDAIQVCLAIHDAQREYASADIDGNGLLEYAMKFASDPGKKNGLYWPTKEGEPLSPLGELAASASAEGYHLKDHPTGPRAYHGYYYRILTSQGPAASGGPIDYVVKGHMIGGFGVIAWPAEYASSGLKSFLVNHQGVVYEKDLGDDTDHLARAMKMFNPDAGWEAVKP
jgi:hypothetical protein